MALHDKAFSERDLKLVETLASEISQLLSYTEPRMAAL
jgi:dihydroneopterin aldolase